ncbi:extracellular solute-binding protein [Algirhabdus cladophorae]|uniref:extracellular solute-binding protein n=1 Tax=Algirhabdus cladophorae TaxID=3377108 RepID=UPI003B848149
MKIIAKRSIATAVAATCFASFAFAQDTIIKTHAYATFGDVKYPADFAHFDYVNPNAPKGGEISIWAPGTFDSFNPYTRKGRSGRLASIGFESLLTNSKDEVSTQYCLVCTTMEYPESEDWVIFNMRPEARFSDGSPVTAHDVVFSHYLFLEQGLPSYARAVSALIPTVEALDDHTVKFTFADDVPRRDLIPQAGGTPIFSKAWYESTEARLDESRLEPGVGSGPYMLDSYDINRQIVYKRNPDYWGKDLPIMRGRSNFDTIRVEYFGDTTAALEGFKAGAYSFRAENSSKTWATAYDFPAVADGTVQKVELPNGNLPVAAGLVFNMRQPQLSDIRVREALGLMFNFEWTNESLQYGLFAQRHSFWENSDMGATGVPEGAELELLKSLGDKVEPSVLTEPAVRAHSSGARQLDRKNLRRASALLDEAGYTVGSDGIRRNADGQTLDIELLEDTPTFDRIFTPYVANLKALGVNANYNRVDPAQYTERTRANDFDMIYFGYRTSPEPGIGTSQWFGSQDVENNSRNPAGYADAGADVLMEKIVASKTKDELQTATRALDRVMRAKRFIVPTWFNDTTWVAYYDQYDHPENLPPYDIGYLDFWWYNADKGQKLKDAGVFQ